MLMLYVLIWFQQSSQTNIVNIIAEYPQQFSSNKKSEQVIF